MLAQTVAHTDGQTRRILKYRYYSGRKLYVTLRRSVSVWEGNRRFAIAMAMHYRLQ